MFCSNVTNSKVFSIGGPRGPRFTGARFWAPFSKCVIWGNLKILGIEKLEHVGKRAQNNHGDPTYKFIENIGKYRTIYENIGNIWFFFVFLTSFG